MLGFLFEATVLQFEDDRLVVVFASLTLDISPLPSRERARERGNKKAVSVANSINSPLKTKNSQP